MEIPGYELGEPVGTGAGGVAWSAWSLSLRCEVVITLRSAAWGAALAGRQAAAAQVAHRAVATIVEVHTLPDGRVAVVSKQLPGQDLATLLAGRAALSPPECAYLLSELSAGLHALHQAGLTHGDISPANVLVGPDGTVRLLDWFGGGVGERGTADFAAPEVAAGLHGERPVEAAADLYALARLVVHAAGGPDSEFGGTCAQVLSPWLRPAAADRPGLDQLLVRAGEISAGRQPLVVADADVLAAQALRRAALLQVTERGRRPARPFGRRFYREQARRGRRRGRGGSGQDRGGSPESGTGEAEATPGTTGQAKPNWHRLRNGGGPGRRPSQAPARTAGGSTHPGGRHDAWVAVRGIGGTLAVVGALVFLAVVLAPGASPSAAPPAAAPGAERATHPLPTVELTAAVPAATASPRPSAGATPAARSRCGLVRELTAQRDAALSAQDAAALAAVSAPDSPAGRADQELLQGLLRAGIEYRQLRTEVTQCHERDDAQVAAVLVQQEVQERRAGQDWQLLPARPAVEVIFELKDERVWAVHAP